MKLAAVRRLPENGHDVILVDCGGFTVVANQIVEVEVDGVLMCCRVVADPAQIVSSPEEATGTLVRVRVSQEVDDGAAADALLSQHPARAFPYLGRAVRTSDFHGIVVRLDIPRRRVQVKLADGTLRVIQAEEITG